MPTNHIRVRPAIMLTDLIEMRLIDSADQFLGERAPTSLVDALCRLVMIGPLLLVFVPVCVVEGILADLVSRPRAE
ncbi:MAG TPA: hypothetical protein VL475_06165 [Planctomycetaceae bacterium]|nr:hypothetical protein [Planctomycetaceae bacterium]